jgi:hypothetical protein
VSGVVKLVDSEGFSSETADRRASELVDEDSEASWISGGFCSSGYGRKSAAKTSSLGCGVDVAGEVRLSCRLARVDIRAPAFKSSGCG